ncbi:uncharacterized protein TNCV_1287041 [Trichonephila clavipes]|nr:uncharacterized protein TNCV_1287041 [Trichonephila clavipes]
MQLRYREMDGNRRRKLSGFQMLNDDEIVTSVQTESDPVVDETEGDEDNINESSKDSSNAGVLRRFVEWAQNEMAVVSDFHKRVLFSDEAHFWLNGYVNMQNCRIWSEANLQVYVKTPLNPEKLTVWCALWAGGILLQKR